MCQIFGDHWGYVERELNYKSIASIIENLCACRRYSESLVVKVAKIKTE